MSSLLITAKRRVISGWRIPAALILLVCIGLLARGPQTGTVASHSSGAPWAPPNGPQVSMPRNGSAVQSKNTNAQPVGIDAGRVRVGYSVKNDTSPPLRSMRNLPPEPGRFEAPENLPLPSFVGKGPVHDPVVQDWFGPLVMPTPILTFEGVNNRNGVMPPDTQGDVGPNHYVQWVNLSFQIWDKNGTSLLGPANGNTLWQGFGGPCEVNNSGDPITLYDPLADRWLMSQFTTSAPYYQCFAVSTTPDPTGSWHRYGFLMSNNLLYDYPKFGVWPDGYYMTANRFLNGASYDSPVADVFDRVNMLAGNPATFQEFNPGNYFFSLLPADVDGSTPPPAGAPNYHATSAGTSDTIRFWRFHVDWVTPSASSFTGPVNIRTAPFDPYLNRIPQQGTASGLDSFGGVFMYRLAYRNMGSYESLVAASAVDTNGAERAGIRWYELRDPGNAPYIYQQGTYSPDQHSRWMPSIAMDRDGNIAVGYSVSSSSMFPAIRYAGRLESDPLGVLAQGEASLIEGGGSQTSTNGRWGDYAMMSVDPADDCTFWFTSEYYQTTAASAWRTRVGKFKFPSCGGPPTSTPTGTPPTATRTPSSTNTPTASPTLCAQYSYATSTATIEAGTVDIGNHCDDCTTYITLPFPVRFYDRTFTNAYVSSNGPLQFASSDNAFGNACLPVPVFDYSIIPFWDDMYTVDAAGGQGIFTSLTGSAPNRVFNIEWRHRTCCSNGAPTHIYEVRLFEGQLNFEIIYGTMGGNGATGTSGIIRDRTSAVQYSCNTATLTAGLKVSWTGPPCLQITPTATATPCTINFSDVFPSDFFYEPVRYLTCSGVISGYADGTFRPYNNTTRGQMTKIIVLAYGIEIYTPPTPTFIDVPVTDTFYQYIETAYENGIVAGYSDGTFRPYANVTRGQLSKIVVEAADWVLIDPAIPTFSDVPPGSTFYQYIETAFCHDIISGYADGTFRPFNNATRGQIAKIVYEAVVGGGNCP